MILFFNVFVTTKAFTIYDRGRLGPSEDRFDVFRYSLASFQPLSWEHVVIYAELDEMYAHRKAELEAYIYSLYPNALFYPYRNKHQRDWKIAMEQLFALPSDDLVWFSCNDDHIFFDYELTLFERLHKAAIKELRQHPHVSIFPFGWAQRICYSQVGYIGHEEPRSYDILERTPDYFKISWGHDDSAQVVSKEVLRKWWFEADYGDAFKPRTDTGPRPKPGVEDIHAIMPWRELSIHYDGSSNVGIDPNAYPAHKMPPGFFTNDIKIQFGGAQRIPGYVWLNPDIETYSSVSDNGVDYRWVIDDIPHFWRGRISEIKVCHDGGGETREMDEFWLRRRNDAVLRTASQFWLGDLQSLKDTLPPVFRRLTDGSIPLSISPEKLNRYRYYSTYKSEPKSAEFSFILLERNLKQTAFQTVHSIDSGAVSPASSQIIWVGSENSFDRAMFSRVSKHLILTDPDARQLRTYHKHAAWNAGASEAESDILIFSDTLNIFPPDFTARARSLVEQYGAVAVRSRYLTFGPYSDGGASDYAALIIKRSLFVPFSEDAALYGEYGGLDVCAAELEARGVKVHLAPENLFCWRVPHPRLSILEGQRVPSRQLSQDSTSLNNQSQIFLEEVNRALLTGDFKEAIRYANQIPLFPGLVELRALLQKLPANGTEVLESTLKIVGAYPLSGQHLALGAAVAFALGDVRLAERLAEQAVSAEPRLLSARQIKLQLSLASDLDAAKAQLFHLIRMYPLEETLWSMIGL